MRFPADAPKKRVLRTLAALGFHVIREAEHIALARDNADGSTTRMTIPNHRTLKRPTLRTICREVNIARADFLEAYEKS